MKTVLSLFDHSGAWCLPFEQAGWNVVQMDLKLGDDVRELSARWFLEGLLQQYPTIDGLLAAPPCTDFSRSGAGHWARKDQDGTTARAVELVYQVLRTVDFLQPDFWAVENPIGRLPRLAPEIGEKKLTFDPWEFGGWTDVTEEERDRLAVLGATPHDQMTSEDVGLVKRANAYTKRTVLWGCFQPPEKRPVPLVRTTAQGSWLMALGGKSERTKEVRSVTPEGFARAFARAQLAV
jgi:hypothetical protein